MADNNNSTTLDDLSINSGSEDALLADILRGSEIAQAAGVAPPPLPDSESQSEQAPEGSEDLEYNEDLDTIPQDSADEDEVEPDDSTEEDEDSSEEDATATPEAYSMDDLEDIMVTHKIDGNDVTKPLSEWIAGSATKQHLSNQGRELGEARKQLEDERNHKLAELDRLGTHLAYASQHEETQVSQRYHEITQKLQQAIAAGDTYEVGELTTEQSKAQQHYWEVRGRREQTEAAVQQQLQQQKQSLFQQEVNHFYTEIENFIPDWEDSMQDKLRSFAIEEGLPEPLVDMITQPAIVKFVDDYRRLKQGVANGAKRRVAAPKSAKKLPTKKGASTKQKQANKKNLVVARAMREDASPEDQMAFLRQHAEKTLGRRD